MPVGKPVPPKRTPGPPRRRASQADVKGQLDYTPTSGGGGKWTTRRPSKLGPKGTIVGTSKAEDSPIKKLGKPSKLPQQKRR